MFYNLSKCFFLKSFLTRGIFSALTALLFLGAGCTQPSPVVPVSKSLVSSDQPLPQPSTNIGENWITPVSLGFDGSCLLNHVVCSDFGQAQLGSSSDTVRARLFLSKDRSTAIVRFYMGNEEWIAIPAFSTPSYVDENSDWFNLKIWYIGGGNLFIATSGGHEGNPQYVSFDPLQTAWVPFNPGDIVKNELSGAESLPFSIDVSNEYIRITEQQPCCSGSFLSDDPERVAYRKIFVLKKSFDQEKNVYKIIDRARVPR